MDYETRILMWRSFPKSGLIGGVMGLFDPRWTKEPFVTELLKHLSSEQISELDKLRREWSFTDREFAMAVAGSPGATYVSTKSEILGLRRRYPNVSPKQMFALVYRRSQMMGSPEFKAQIKVASKNSAYQKLMSDKWDQEERNAIKNPGQFETLDRVDTIDDLVWCVLNDQGLVPIDPYGVFEKINSILGLKGPKGV